MGEFRRVDRPDPTTHPYVVVWEYPSDEDDFPGRVIHYFVTWQEAMEVCSRLNQLLAKTQPVKRGERFGHYYVRNRNCTCWPWIDVGFFDRHPDNVHGSEGRQKPDYERIQREQDAVRHEMRKVRFV